MLYTLTGEAVPDNYTANHKTKSGFFKRFITQETAYEVGNGVTFKNTTTKEKLGGERLDSQLYKAVKNALIDSVSYGFFNFNHIDFFRATEFVPLIDEENGALKAGIRFWQLNSDKPLRATLYEIDGFTEYEFINNIGKILKNKRTYKIKVIHSDADGDTISPDGNYPDFPIVPLWGNMEHQSELAGKREQIDCYDLIKSGFANDLDDASMIYWTLSNAGGMDDMDLAKFVERMKTLKAAVVSGDEDGAKAEAHTLDVPYQSRTAYLEMLEKDLYKDFMALNTEQIAAQNVTATQIKAAYEALNHKADELEMCLFDFFTGIFAVAGITGEIPEFKRSKIINISEEVQTIISAEPFIGNEEATRQICAVLGISDKFESIMKTRISEETERFEIEKEEGEEK